MYTDFIAQSESQLHESDLNRRLERRRVTAERAVAAHGGERLALMAALARQARQTRTTGRLGSRPTVAGC